MFVVAPTCQIAIPAKVLDDYTFPMKVLPFTTPRVDSSALLLPIIFSTLDAKEAVQARKKINICDVIRFLVNIALNLQIGLYHICVPLYCCVLQCLAQKNQVVFWIYICSSLFVKLQILWCIMEIKFIRTIMISFFVYPPINQSIMVEGRSYFDFRNWQPTNSVIHLEYGVNF